MSKKKKSSPTFRRPLSPKEQVEQVLEWQRKQDEFKEKNEYAKRVILRSGPKDPDLFDMMNAVIPEAAHWKRPYDITKKPPTDRTLRDIRKALLRVADRLLLLNARRSDALRASGASFMAHVLLLGALHGLLGMSNQEHANQIVKLTFDYLWSVMKAHNLSLSEVMPAHERERRAPKARVGKGATRRKR